MKILALETSTEYCSVALYLDGKILNKEILAERRHSEILLPMIQEILAEAELTLRQIDGIAFGAGPGSFTGLRIACGVAQGLAYAVTLPVVGISTLEAVAQKTGEQKVIVALDARMGEIYHAAYQQLTSHTWKIISPPILCSPQQSPSIVGNEWNGCGSGFEVYSKELTLIYNNNLQKIHYGFHPQAGEIAQLALPKFTDGSNTDPANAAPIYIRNKVALKESER
ncbi:tRNA threonylcarbamoyladenosine biosynthesis protein TsaB [Nitrosomonas sp. Nm84]|uniref:tRNA (adenosine(37)-N6)-threonylcarbamoyltransferase complex dimerization subunit type 1 TsaB n=1 Tax=Nitrosomonas sp. Nm84 TaxID=200124 RepID=UPI000D75737B|nr:tRNA (adenosine(37)-N6)-threonylcarbamoyltransferase complex dimerization subunit type 1 TsaB [Nitrosomonas sp. Nm84]PXW90801.1 tRNA threonylcarbamoyladenosine biosynthesis protein TsaB [Nitrosomonas sp. Nm84]